MGKIVEAFIVGVISETGGVLIFVLIMIVVEVVGGFCVVVYMDII